MSFPLRPLRRQLLRRRLFPAEKAVELRIRNLHCQIPRLDRDRRLVNRRRRVEHLSVRRIPGVNAVDNIERAGRIALMRTTAADYRALHRIRFIPDK